MGITRAELEACRGKSVPDLVGENLRLLFVGINPGLWTTPHDVDPVDLVGPQ